MVAVSRRWYARDPTRAHAHLRKLPPLVQLARFIYKIANRSRNLVRLFGIVYRNSNSLIHIVFLVGVFKDYFFLR